ncbi:MAG: hypothetical protein GX027_02760 [Clostridiaceae bacterium]|jgi:FtsH-binding integral membrane protein|nr:hypothetical protein [Clostridiaceae bacterium]
MNNRKYVAGVLLVLLGIVIIIGNVGLFNMSWLFRLSWPMIILMISGFFFLGFASRRPYGTGLLVPAGFFLVLGVTFILGEIFGYRLLWPGFVAAPAIGLLLLYLYGSRSSGLLVPVGVLLSIASICFISELFGIWRVTWPGFILAPAVGLFLMYLADGHKNSALLIPIFILTFVSMVAFTFTLFSFRGFMDMVKYLFGGVLILGGIITLLGRPARRDQYNHDDHMSP